MPPRRPKRERPVQDRCCTALLAVWNHVFKTRFVASGTPLLEHCPIDFIARDPQGTVLLIEHGQLPTFDGCREGEAFVRDHVASELRRGLQDVWPGNNTELRVLTTGGRAAHDIVPRLIRAIRRDPGLLSPGRRDVTDTGGVLASIAVDHRRGALGVGPAIDASLDGAIADLRRRLHRLAEEQGSKFAMLRETLDPRHSHVRVLLVEADDYRNLSDAIYANLFDSIASTAGRAGLAAMWRVAADSADEVRLWQEWDARTTVPTMRRFFRWVERDGSVHEV